MKDKINLSPKSDNKSNHKKAYSSSQYTLPKTGENKRLTLISIGIGTVLLVLVFLTFLLYFRKQKNNYHE